MSNHKEIKKLVDKYKEADYIILSEDHKNKILEFKSRLKGLKVPKQKPTLPNFEEILFAMENRINSKIDVITSDITEIKLDIVNMENRINSKIDNLKNEMNNRFDKLELRVSILEGFHKADFAKN